MATIKKMTAHCDACGCDQEIAAMTQEVVGMKCPKCGKVMITQKDLDIYLSLMDVFAACDKLVPNSPEVIEAQIRIKA